ncbi:putative phage tail protein [Paenibacillus rhizoplanae]
MKWRTLWPTVTIRRRWSRLPGGLSRWERLLGLASDTNKSYATRREMIKAKLRGSGTTTPEMIRRTASAFFPGEMWR